MTTTRRLGDPHIPGVAKAVRQVARQGEFAPKDVKDLLITTGVLDLNDWWAMYCVGSRIQRELVRAIDRGHVEKLGYGTYTGTSALQ